MTLRGALGARVQSFASRKTPWRAAAIADTTFARCVARHGTQEHVSRQMRRPLSGAGIRLPSCGVSRTRVERDLDQLRRLESLLATLESEDAIRKSRGKGMSAVLNHDIQGRRVRQDQLLHALHVLLRTALENRSDGLNMLAVHSALWLAFCGLDFHGRCAGATK